MKTRFQLPPAGSKSAVESALKYHYEISLGEHQQFSYEWTRIHWFLQGIRNTQNSWVGNSYPWRGGVQSPNYIDPQTGQRRVRIEFALGVHQTEMGRILSMDLGPSVVRRVGMTLDDIRQAGVSAAALDNFWERCNTTNFRQDLAHQLVAYGTAGIGCFAAPPGQGVFGCTLAVIPAWELLPLPGGITGIDQQSGVCWRRWVPLGWLKKHFKDMLEIPRDESLLRVRKQHTGVMLHEDISPRPNGSTIGIGLLPVAVGGSSFHETTSASSKGDPKTSETFVEMKESWLVNDDYSCTRWSIMLGDKLVLDVDYTDEKSRRSQGLVGNNLPIAPLHVARYLTIGSFWGRGKIDRVMHMNRELELAVGDLLTANRNKQRLTKMFLPLDSGLDIDTMNQSATGQYAMWAPNMASPEVKPFILEPAAGSADTMGKTVNLLHTILNETSQQGPSFRGESMGRADSSGAIQQIRADQEMPMVSVGESLAAAMIGVHKSTLHLLRQTLPTDPNLKITRLDESLVGVKFDYKTGRLQLQKTDLPDPQDVEITIRSRVPVSREAKTQRLRENLQAGIINPIEYKILAIRDDLDTGLLSRAVYENYKAAWASCHSLFGDGASPGTIILPTYAINKAIYLMVVLEFMAMTSFMAATVGVRDAFKTLKNELTASMGGLPEPLANLSADGQPQPPSPEAQQLATMGMPPQVGGVGGPGGIPYPDALSMLSQGV